MKLALHQLRHEIRRARVFLAVYLVILLGNLAVAAGWIGQPEYNERYNGWGNENVLPGFIAMAFWIALTLMVMGTTTADSPSNKDRLLATRPFPLRPLVTAKALFILLTLLLPAVVVEFLSLRATDAPTGIIALGTIEHLVLLGIFSAFVALFAAHWSSASTAKLALAVTIGISAAFIGSIGTLTGHLGRNSASGRIRIPEPTMLTATIGTAVICLGLAVTLRLHTRRQWKTRQLILPFAGLVLLWFAIAAWIPLRSLSLPASGQDIVEQTIAAKPDAIGFTPAPVSHSLFNDRPAANYNIIPAMSAHPDDWEIRWSATATEWSGNGRVIHRERSGHRPAEASVISPGAAIASPALLAALQTHAPGIRLLVPPSMGRENAPRPSLPLGMLSFPKKDLPTEPISVSSQITTTAYRWKLAASIPAGSNQPASSGPWHLEGIHEQQRELKAFLCLDTHRLHTVADPSQLANRYGWTGNVLFALHVPERQMLWIGDARHCSWISTLSSADRTYGEVQFRSHMSNTPGLSATERQSARLLVFQAEPLGAVSRTFRSPEFTLAPRSGGKAPVLAAVRRPHQPQGTPAAFARWLSQHGDLPADLPATRLTKHLDEFFNLECRSGAYLEYPRSPAVNHLARFVPQHRDLFLDSIRGMTSESSAARLVLKALTQGATGDDKPTIIAALAETPILIETINARGWTGDARAELVALLQSSPANLDALQAVVSLNDPALDELLLKAFQTSRSIPAYQSLRPIPRLRERLEAITRDLWSPGLVTMDDNLVDRRLELALTQGRTDALAHFFDLLPHLDQHGSSTWQATDLAERVFHLPAGIREHRHNSDKLFDWLRGQKAESFRFDPVLQRFVLINPNTI